VTLKTEAREIDIIEHLFDTNHMTVAAFDLTPDEVDTQAAHFDDTDGAYDVAEPDPFADSNYPAKPLRHPSLRAELGTAPAKPITGLARPALPPLPVLPGLDEILPDGLRRGSTIAVTSSVSLLLALIGGPSMHGAWSAIVGMPTISAEAASEAGIDLSRLAIISPPDISWTGASWTTAVGALLDAVDVVVARTGDTTRISDGEARRLTARARGKDAVLVLFGQQASSWPAVEIQLTAQHDHWTGIGDGYGRIKGRQLTVSATGKGRSARPRTAQLWLPATGQSAEPAPNPLELSIPARLIQISMGG
jgi:hypothetical protein